MSALLPEIVDAWRMVAARRSFQGSLPLAAMPRLAASLASTGGTVSYALEFGRDELGTAYIDLSANASLPLLCQRTLESFALPVTLGMRLGLIAKEEEESGLSPGYEPLLTSDGQIRPADVIEDELILAVPVIPVRPGSEIDAAWSAASEENVEPIPERESPFALLGRLRQNDK